MKELMEHEGESCEMEGQPRCAGRVLSVSNPSSHARACW